MNIFIIIQARMTSSRLPGKVMLPLCDKPALEIMLDRLVSFKNNIIIATTNDGTQTPIVDLCKRLGIKYYEGDTNNVLSRYYEAAIKYGAGDNDIIVRCTSDCPLIDPDVVRAVIFHYQKNLLDYSAAGSGSGFPRGLDTEVFSFSLLKEAFLNATKEYEKEHVTPYIYDTCKSKFKIDRVKSEINASKYRITLDEYEDYLAIKEIYKKLNCSTSFNYDDLIDVLESNQYIYEINAHVEQKKLNG